MKQRSVSLLVLLLGLVTFLPLRANAAASEGATRSWYFMQMERTMMLRGDPDGLSYVKQRAVSSPAAPPRLSIEAERAHPDLAAQYDLLRRRTNKAILVPIHESADQWRVDRAEADLHVVWWELKQGRAAAFSFVLEHLRDASLALNHHIYANGVDDEIILPPPPPPPPPTVQIQAEPGLIMRGDPAIVSWRSTDATEVILNGQKVSLEGSMEVRPEATTVYSIIAKGPGGRASMATQVVVSVPSPTLLIEVRPGSVTRGACARLIWSSSNADKVTINGEEVALQGSREECPSVSRTYDATATGPGGSTNASAALTVNLSPPIRHRIHFDFDEWTIREDAGDTLTLISNLMRRNPEMQIRIEGHCDAKGSDDYNHRLSTKRAETVRDYFVSQFGINPTRFQILGRSEADPLAANTLPDGADNPAGRALNRRAEFIEVR